MTEFIVRLTPEQEQLYRKDRTTYTGWERGLWRAARTEIDQQVRDALALYDQLVTEAQAKSDD